MIGEHSSGAARVSRARKLYTVEIPKKSWFVTGVGLLFSVYAMLPFVWLLINATKTQHDYISTSGFSFGRSFALWDNIQSVFTFQNGIFGRWVLNTLVYTLAGTVVSTLLSALGGYALAKLDFPFSRTILLVVLGAISVPGIALAIPQFLLFAQMGITETMWAVLLPSFLSPFGLYLMWVFAGQSIPDGLIEAARVDGAGEFRIFFSVALPILPPALVTVALFQFVAIWNNYFLPLIMLKNQDLFPLALGLAQWNAQSGMAGSSIMIQNLVITGSLLTIIPLIVAFLCLQRYWQSGLALGAVKE